MSADGNSESTQQDGTTNTTKWIVMVFMGAATIKGNAPLIKAAEDDLAEMRFVGSGDNLNIFVQVHQGPDVPPRRARILPETEPRIDALGEVPKDQQDPTGGAALLGFIGWALENYRRGDRTLLVLWGHAYDFAIGREQTARGIIDALDFAELSVVLETLQQRFGEGAKLDILGCDACDLATVEMAYEIKPFANYLLCSQIGIPIPGWPYDRILYRLRHPVGEIMNPAEFGSWAVRRFCEAYSADSGTVSLTLLDLNRADELLDRAQLLTLALAMTIGDPGTQDHIAELFSQSRTGAGRPYVDVADLCLNLVRNSDDMRVVGAAQALGDFLIDPHVDSKLPTAGSRGAKRPFVMEHGRNTCETARLNGVSLYAPHVAPDIDFEAVLSLYQKFVFTQKTRWSELVHVLARSR